ncbi:hypothetical protein LSUE1_G009919 [Lachnellula suecica]|uniref:Uncharacterized protein n=1 Tax=Lachnellula suecica TaxID=602035 RepID=A0A8T9BYP0_9HELO|nr:hypothetical protein LSUE1_G009919 [Lachnellula suecica]
MSILWAMLLFSTLSQPPKPDPQLSILGPVASLLNKLPMLNTPPPGLTTKNPSPECAGVNQGARLCCESTLDGGAPSYKNWQPLLAINLLLIPLMAFTVSYVSVDMGGWLLMVLSLQVRKIRFVLGERIFAARLMLSLRSFLGF